MLTQDVTKELEAVMEQLQQQGKEPTVALVKARLKTPVPMPALITAIKSWKSAQRVPKIEIAAQHHTDNDRIQKRIITPNPRLIKDHRCIIKYRIDPRHLLKHRQQYPHHQHPGIPLLKQLRHRAPLRIYKTLPDLPQLLLYLCYRYQLSQHRHRLIDLIFRHQPPRRLRHKQQ